MTSSLEPIEEPFDGAGATALFPALIAELQALYPEWTPDVPPKLTAQDVEPPKRPHCWGEKSLV